MRARRLRPLLEWLEDVAYMLRWSWLQDRCDDWLFPQQARDRKRFAEPEECERPCGS